MGNYYEKKKLRRYKYLNIQQKPRRTANTACVLYYRVLCCTIVSRSGGVASSNANTIYCHLCTNIAMTMVAVLVVVDNVEELINFYSLLPQRRTFRLHKFIHSIQQRHFAFIDYIRYRSSISHAIAGTVFTFECIFDSI